MVTAIFTIIAVAAIVAGGLLAAFSARKPGWTKNWLSAYLVLVVGAIQLGLVTGWHYVGSPHAGLALAAFVLYNIGNVCVTIGTVAKTSLSRYSAVVAFGGLLLAIAMVLLLVAVHSAPTSWTLAGVVALAAIILASMPVGVVLSHSSKTRLAS